MGSPVSFSKHSPSPCPHPSLTGRLDLCLDVLTPAELAARVDCVFGCLPHGVSSSVVPHLLEAGTRVVDFSADYRLQDVGVYEQFYQVKHTDTTNLKDAAYGLPELFREKVKATRLVANPGCFPTGAVLALAPLLKAGLVETDSIIVNAVTGSSGAGKNPSNKFHFPNMNENAFPYGIGTHRHMPEIEQIAGEVAGSPVQVLFQPHVGPFDRGILSSVYCRPRTKVASDQLWPLYNDFYQAEPFVQIPKTAPGVKDVCGTNYCHIFPALAKGRIVVFSAIDNLVKGASGQAIQNMNILFGLRETMGLD